MRSLCDYLHSIQHVLQSCLLIDMSCLFYVRNVRIACAANFRSSPSVCPSSWNATWTLNWESPPSAASCGANPKWPPSIWSANGWARRRIYTWPPIAIPTWRRYRVRSSPVSKIGKYCPPKFEQIFCGFQEYYKLETFFATNTLQSLWYIMHV